LRNHEISSNNLFIKQSYFQSEAKTEGTNEIKTAISNSRSKYKIWRDNGKPSEVENVHLQEKKKTKRHLRKTIRIEQAKQRNKEKELIMETKTKDMKLFHKLVRNNRKKGISFVHTFNFGFALKIALFDDEVIAADFMISQILIIFSPIQQLVYLLLLVCVYCC
jgi:hypothetical protein